MSAAHFISANKQRVGYSARWVFGAGGSGRLGKFARVSGRAKGGAAMIGATICGAGQAGIGGNASVPAIKRNQALSCAVSGQVERFKSNGAAGSAEICGFRGKSRHIANYRTRPRSSAGLVDPTPLPARAQRRPVGGGLPPFGPRSRPLSGSRRSDLTSGKTGPSLPLRPWPPMRSRAGRAKHFIRTAGVRGVGARESVGSSAKKRQILRIGSGFGADEHIQIDQGKAAKLGGGCG